MKPALQESAMGEMSRLISEIHDSVSCSAYCGAALKLVENMSNVCLFVNSLSQFIF